MGLTVRQAEALAFIRSRIAATGVSPTLAEIGDHVGTAKSGAHRLVHVLAERGAIRLLPNRARAIVLVDNHFTQPIEAGLTFLADRTGQSREQLVAQAVTEFLDRQVQA